MNTVHSIRQNVPKSAETTYVRKKHDLSTSPKLVTTLQSQSTEAKMINTHIWPIEAEFIEAIEWRKH